MGRTKIRLAAAIIAALMMPASVSAGETVSGVIASAEFAENTIPVFYIHIDESRGTIAEMNESPDHSVKCYGTVDIKVPEGFVSEYTEEVQESLEGLELEYIRGRGNSTWDQPKKPYRLKFGKKQDLFGMGASKN